MARVRSVLRRCAVDNQDSEDGPKHTMAFGPFFLDVDKHQLSRDSRDVPLTSGEFTLLKTFLENPNRVLNRDALLEKTKGYEHVPLDRSVDVCVGRLRRKIEDDPAEPLYLHTVWGSGYLFTVEK